MYRNFYNLLTSVAKSDIEKLLKVWEVKSWKLRDFIGSS